MTITEADKSTLLDAAYLSGKYGIPLSTYQFNLIVEYFGASPFTPDTSNADQWASLRAQFNSVAQQKFKQQNQ